MLKYLDFPCISIMFVSAITLMSFFNLKNIYYEPSTLNPQTSTRFMPVAIGLSARILEPSPGQSSSK